MPDSYLDGIGVWRCLTCLAPCPCPTHHSHTNRIEGDRLMTPTTAAAQPAAFSALDERYERLPIEQLLESAFNPRKTFNETKLKELSASILEKGVVEPIVVRQVDAGNHKPMRFEIVAGARRYRASKLASLTHMPAIIRMYSDVQVVEIMAIENGQRDDVLPLEEAAGYKQLLGLDKGYTAAMIAERIGRSEKYVWDRLKLLDLIPAAKDLLAAGIIGVEHAEIIAKEKPSDQGRIIGRQNGGLFTGDYALEFDDKPRTGSTAYDRLKAVSVRELRQWIASHIRFDVQHAAAAAPLEFGPVAQRVEEHLRSEVGPRKKIVSIVFDHMCPDGAKDENERTYGATAWKKAEGKDGQPTCEHAVLGVVVAGEKYGQTFRVCIARDKCRTHWAEVVKAKEKSAKLRESGKGKQAAKVDAAAEARERAKQQEEQRQREAWRLLEPHILDEALEQVKSAKSLTPAQAKFIEQADIDVWGLGKFLRERLGKAWFKTPAAAWLALVVYDENNHRSFDEYVKAIAKPVGLNIKRLEAVRDKHQPKPAAVPAKKTA